MATFSWSDSIRATFGPCLSCLKTGPEPDDEDHGPHFIPRARPDELEGLLADSDDAETLSLHSNVGDYDARRRRRRPPPSHTGIKLFGFYLFGRPPIHLPDDDDPTYGGARSSRRNLERARTISASTLDSDASPLDPSTIDELTAARVAERIAQQHEAERLAKEERRRQRRERKEAQRAALALALHATEGEEFEGFQGSGPSPALTQSGGSDTYSSVAEEFGPYQDGHDLEGEIDGGDFGAEHYARRTSVSAGSDRSRSHSHSASSPDPSQYNHHYISQQPLPHSQVEQHPHRHHKKRPSSGHTGRRPSLTSRSSTSQSASVPSPTVQQTSFPAIAEHDVSQAASVYATPDDLSAMSVHTGFPSAGLRGGTPSRKNSQSGVFLARTGDD